MVDNFAFGRALVIVRCIRVITFFVIFKGGDVPIRAFAECDAIPANETILNFTRGSAPVETDIISVVAFFIVGQRCWVAIRSVCRNDTISAGSALKLACGVAAVTAHRAAVVAFFGRNDSPIAAGRCACAEVCRILNTCITEFNPTMVIAAVTRKSIPVITVFII